MDFWRKSPYEFSVEDLDKELIARGARESNEKWFKFSDSMEIHERDEIMRQVTCVCLLFKRQYENCCG